MFNIFKLITALMVEGPAAFLWSTFAFGVAATAVSKVAEQQIKGARMEIWKFTLDPGSIAAAAQEVDTIAVPGAKAGDPCSVSFEAPDANVITGGAKVTGNDVVSVYLSNNITVTTATDGAAMQGYLTIHKLGVALA